MPGTLASAVFRYHRWNATTLCGMVVGFLLAPITGRAAAPDRHRTTHALIPERNPIFSGVGATM